MKPIIRHGVLLLAFFAYSTSALACGCDLKQITINPIEPARNDIFIGKAKTIEIRFRNENSKQTIDVFPEPPLTIRHLSINTQCDIDGGIWVRNSVYLSADEKTLLVQEFSGSNDQLVLYDTTSCRRQTDLDISGARWKIADNKIFIGKKCSSEDVKTCQSVKQFRFDKLCKPIQNKTNKTN